MGLYSNLHEMDVDVELFGEDKLRYDDLDSNSTFYEWTVAAPDDKTLRIMWSVDTTVVAFTTTFIMVVFASIALSKKARSTPFNVYILFLSFPDWVYSGLCLITCLLCAINNDYYSMDMCLFQSFYLVFGTAANCWLNAVISYEVHRLLKVTRAVQKYRPPSMISVVKRSMASYGIALFLGLITIIQSPNYPMKVAPNYGFVCIPVQETWQDLLFFYLFFIPLYVGIPFGYVFYVFYDVVFGSKLLPKIGKRRDIAIYFFRISFVFLLFWAPVILLIYMFRIPNYWVRYAFGILSHLQGAASAGVSLMKSDVKEAFVNFITCKWRSANDEYVEEHRLLKSGVKKCEIRAMRSKTNVLMMSNYPYDMPRQREDFKFEDEVEHGVDESDKPEAADPEVAQHSSLVTTGVAEYEEEKFEEDD